MKDANIELKVTKNCPFVCEKPGLHQGIYMLAGDDEVSYICGINGSSARGGNQRNSIPGGANTPCSMEYTKNCQIYQKNIQGVK